MLEKKFKSLSRMLLVRVLIFSSIFTSLVTSVSFYFDYSSRMNEMYGLFNKIEGSTAQSISFSAYNYSIDAMKTQVDGLLSIPEITKVEVFDSDGKYLYKGESEAAMLSELTLTERMAKSLLPTVLLRSTELKHEHQILGKLLYTASLISVYGRLLERLFIFFISQAIKTFSVSAFILLMCRMLFTRKLSALSESVLKSKRQKELSISDLDDIEDRDYFTELDVLVEAIATFHKDSRDRARDRKELSIISEKVLWMIRDREISDFAAEKILRNSGMDECHFYQKGGNKLELHSSFFRAADKKDADIEQVLEIKDLSKLDRIFKEEQSEHGVKLIIPIHRGGSLLGAFLGYGSEEVADQMIENSEFWLTISRIISMALIHSRLYENLEKTVEFRTKELRLTNEDLEIAREKLQASLESKKLLLRTLCHDLNNPIATIKAACFKLKENEKYKNKMQRALENLIGQIDFIRVSQALEDGKIMMNKELISVQTIIDDVMLLFEERFLEKGIEFSFKEEVKGMEINVDPNQFGNIVINNLISNSIKFTRNGGRISVIARQGEDGRTEIIVSDTGIGIPANILKNLFDTNAPTSRKGTAGEHGTGFGMPLVKTIVKQLGGEISVSSQVEGESSQEHGTTFTIALGAAKRV